MRKITWKWIFKQPEFKIPMTIAITITLIGLVLMLLSGCSLAPAISCVHDFRVQLEVYAEPSNVDLTDLRGSSNAAHDYYKTVQRVALGTTTIIYQCKKCLYKYREILLGKRGE